MNHPAPPHPTWQANHFHKSAAVFQAHSGQCSVTQGSCLSGERRDKYQGRSEGCSEMHSTATIHKPELQGSFRRAWGMTRCVPNTTQPPPQSAHRRCHGHIARVLWQGSAKQQLPSTGVWALHSPCACTPQNFRPNTGQFLPSTAGGDHGIGTPVAQCQRCSSPTRFATASMTTGQNQTFSSLSGDGPHSRERRVPLAGPLAWHRRTLERGRSGWSGAAPTVHALRGNAAPAPPRG